MVHGQLYNSIEELLEDSLIHPNITDDDERNCNDLENSYVIFNNVEERIQNQIEFSIEVIEEVTDREYYLNGI